jgi:hypothetical protein
MRKLAIAALFLLLPLASFAQSATDVDKSIDSNLGNHAQFRTLFANLQKSVATHDAAAVAALVHYPITVKINGHATTFRTPERFIASYDQIFTPAIAEVVTGQNYTDLFVNYKGVMFGNGEVWLNSICQDPTDKPCKVSVAEVVTIQDLSDMK